MRRIVYGGASSLDQHFARADHSIDWLRWSDDAAAIMHDFWPAFDTVLMGRKTWEAAQQNGMSEGYPGMRNYLFSRTLTADPAPGVTLVRENAAEVVRNLKQESGQDICLMGGGDLARTLFDADLIDEVGLNIHPVILGAGVAALPPLARQVNLDLLECRQIAHGCVYVRYQVVH